MVGGAAPRDASLRLSTSSTIQSDPLRTALTHALAILALVAPLCVLVAAALGHSFAIDFRHAFLPASHAVLRGTSPYDPVGVRALAQGPMYLYPPLGAYLLTPFTLLSPVAAELVATGLLVATVPATLLLLDVRDWRCHAAAFLWFPTIIGIQTGNLTLPLLLGLALVWRYRGRPCSAGVAVALLVALKLFFWPLLVWLIATRRYGTAAIAGVVSVLLVILPWAGIGFAGIGSYPHLLASVAHTEGPHSYSVAALAYSMLPNWTAATALETVLGAALLVVVLAEGRRGRDRNAFALTVIAVLALTPLLEIHYFAALLVVVALYRRRFSLGWAAPLLLWGAPAGLPNSAIQIVHVLGVVAVTLLLTMRVWTPPGFARAWRPGSA